MSFSRSEFFQSKKPSSCTECHLSGVDLKDYIFSDQAKTFAALKEQGLINTKEPENSKILKFIARKPKQASLVSEKIRQQELTAFRSWILAAVKDPKLLSAQADEDLIGARLPESVIRHARKDRVLHSFIENVWSEVMRCAACHSPLRNQKQVREHGKQVSWITPRSPQKTLEYLISASLIDVEFPEDSLLLTKPTLQVDHKGGIKMLVGDRSYKQFRAFIEDYAAVVNGKYNKPSQLPKPKSEFTLASESWFKLIGIPAKYDKMLLQVDLYRKEGQRWSKTRWATADRPVFGPKGLWQQSLSLCGPAGSERAQRFRKIHRLPPGQYRVKIYIDQAGKLKDNYQAVLSEKEFIGEVVLESKWPAGYQRMTVAKFLQVKD